MLFTGVFTPFTPNVIIAKIDENFGFGTYTMLHLLWFSLCLFYSEFLEIIDSFQEFFSSNRSYFFHCFFFFFYLFPLFWDIHCTNIISMLDVSQFMESFILSIFSFLFFRMDYFYWFIFSFLEISLLSFQIYFWANLVRGWEPLQTGRPQISTILSWRPAALH